jgi:D-lactate dehydrogenase (cytochrome)
VATHLIRARSPAAGLGSHVDIERRADAIAPYLEDAAHFPGGRADGVARPESEADVAQLVQAATHVLPIGAQSSVTGGATPAGGLVLSTGRLLTVQESGRDRIRAGAGITIDALQDLLSATGRWYAPFPTFTGATVGGIVSTNAAGAATFKYGTTRDWVEALTVVLACGCVLDLERGAVLADAARRFAIECAHGRRELQAGSYRMPDVPKCSAGYFAAPSMDLIDLFIGAEGTLGVIVDATLRVLPARPATALALVPVASEASGLALVRELRERARETWTRSDPHGIDVAAVEHLDRRCLELLREDAADRRLGVTWPPGTAIVLLVQLELAPGARDEDAFDEIAAAGEGRTPATRIGRFCDILRRHGAFADAEIVLPGHASRAAQLLAFREAAPLGVNQRVGAAKRRVDPRIDKTAADMIVPFGRLGDMLAVYRDGFARRGLDYAIWGHISDGNVHPNVIPATYDDVLAGREAILEFGREVTGLGGCPLAEHGVGRSALKQRLLRELYGAAGIEQMRAVKRVLDPALKLAPGVLFERETI